MPEKKTENVWSFAKLGVGGGVWEGSKKPNLYFGVKNGLKWPKKHVKLVWEITKPGGGVRGGLAKDQTFSVLFSRHPSLM